MNEFDVKRLAFLRDKRNAEFDYDILEAKYLEEPLEEVIDKTGHFVRVPSVSPKLYPGRTEAFEILSSMQKFSKIEGFGEPKYIPLKYYYLLSTRYIERLCCWLLESENSETIVDLTVNNSLLFEEKSVTCARKRLQPYYKMVNEEVWKKLMKWFGGGISLRLKCLEEDSKPKGILIRVVCQNNNSQFKRMYFNVNTNILEVKIEICASFDIKEDKCRLHDFFNSMPYAQIDQPQYVQFNTLAKKSLFQGS